MRVAQNLAVVINCPHCKKSCSYEKEDLEHNPMTQCSNCGRKFLLPFRMHTDKAQLRYYEYYIKPFSCPACKKLGISKKCKGLEGLSSHVDGAFRSPKSRKKVSNAHKHLVISGGLENLDR